MCLNRTKRREMITESQNRPDNRWEMLRNMNDAREIWQAIGCNGIIGDNKAEERPSDEDFKQYFQKLLSPPDAEPIFVGRAGHWRTWGQPWLTYLPIGGADKNTCAGRHYRLDVS